jgi:Fe2+ transport system protein FeoA
MLCCPDCGYSWVDPERSAVGRFLRGWLGGRGRRHRRRGRHAVRTLADVPVGWKARLHSWDALPSARRQQLRAYGLGESEWMTVLQHAPTTVIRVQQTELALERELAAAIVVEAAQPDEAPAAATARST